MRHFCFAPLFHEWKWNIVDFFYLHKKVYFSQILCTNVFKSMLVNSSPLPRQSIHLTGVAYQDLIKQRNYHTGVPRAGHSKCAVLSHDTTPQRECAVWILTAGVPTTAVALCCFPAETLNVSCCYQMSLRSLTCEWSQESNSHTESHVSLIFSR